MTPPATPYVIVGRERVFAVTPSVAPIDTDEITSRVVERYLRGKGDPDLLFGLIRGSVCSALRRLAKAGRVERFQSGRSRSWRRA